MIFQCQASELEKAVAKIKNWKAQLDTVPKNRQRLSSAMFCTRPPVEVHLAIKKNDTLRIDVIDRAKDRYSVEVKGMTLCDNDYCPQMTLHRFYSFCENLCEGSLREKFTGTVEITADHYEVSMFKVIQE